MKKSFPFAARRSAPGFLLMVGIVIFTLAACSPMIRLGDSPGISGYSYSLGTLKVLYKAGLMETWDATLAAVSGKGLKVKDSGHGVTTAKIVAIDADEKIVTISLEYKSYKETEAAIRVGYLGDQDASASLAESIRAVLF